MTNIDLIIICLAREIKNKDVVFLGVCSPIPMLAIALAKKTHAPDLIYINSLGAINPEINFSYSSDNIDSLKTNKFIELHEIYDIAQKRKLDITFFSGAQVDKKGNINLSVIGDYKNPKVRLPGGAGSPVLIRLAKKSIILCLKHDKKRLVEKINFVTSPGKDDKERIGRAIKIITSKCIFIIEKKSIVLESIHPNITLQDIKENTGFEFKIPEKILITKNVSEKEIKILNHLDPKRKRYQL